MTPPLLIEILVLDGGTAGRRDGGDGVDELNALAPFRVLRGAVGAGANFAVRLVILTAVEEVTAFCGLRFRSDGVLGEPDILVVPGGGWAARSDIGAWGEAHRGIIPTAITLQGERGAIVAAVCTGAMLAAYGGLVAGRRRLYRRHATAEFTRYARS